MRFWIGLLTALLIVIQWPLWFGKGSWLRVHDLRTQLDKQRQANEVLSDRNEVLAAELRSLRDGREAVQERARLELNMIRSDEVFFQLVPGPDTSLVAPPISKQP